MWQEICTFLSTFLCLHDILSYLFFSLSAIPPAGKHFFSFYSPISPVLNACCSHKNICRPSKSCRPIILPYRYIFVTISSQHSSSSASNISQSNPYRSLFPVHCLSISFHSSGYLLARSISISTPLHIFSTFSCFFI